MQYIDIPQLPTGRALFAFEQMRPLLAAHPDLTAQLDVARDAAQALRDLEAQHSAAAEATRRNARGEAQRIDYALDAALGELAKLVAALARLGDEHPQGAAASAFQKRFFPNGVSAMIQTVYEEQLRQMEDLLEAIQVAPAADWATALPIEPYIETVRTLTPSFRTELEKAAPAAVTYAQVRAERRAAHAQLELLVAGVYFVIQEPAEHAKALAPLTLQIERHRALRRGRRAPRVDVDPRTGAEVETEPVEA